MSGFERIIMEYVDSHLEEIVMENEAAVREILRLKDEGELRGVH